MATISALTITKNEESNISDCLASVRWTTERIVIDAESRDRTPELARAAGAQVIVRPWPGFGAQKNFGISTASSEWILIVDADERVSPPLQDEIRRRIDGWRAGEPVAFEIPRKNFFYGAWVRHAGVYPDYQLRLFRKGAALYNDVPVHENLIVEGPVGKLEHAFEHHTERTIQDHFKKFGLYTTLAAQEKGKTARRVRGRDLLFRPWVVFFKQYVLKQGFRDGIRGLLVCVFASMYTFVKYAKLWDALRSRSVSRDHT
ncbi:Lipopolysaccharide core biosynthesis glycosyltransferase WaaE [Nitrospira sp. KM1]|uniref:glycosyltransferase family 2 protein n=1 Tax=Nitrospira sp. KM1 TaxID=1936990 RepID=UPI0013A731C1|nr:glycosyltransferase family 2 protein [Nitrospira sp. KM1]BCA54240.1 Lipopolysaccharide core biosynthesis glycosyltransferase WaaE [Nitrospira sp. KM1]